MKLEEVMFENISNEVLLVDCKKEVLKEKRVTARVLEYLSEIDKRQLWVKEGYSSLWDFCVRYLGYSEGETRRRIHASRLVSRMEEVKPMLEEGQLSLTTISLLSPHLNSTNAKEILPMVISKSTREVEEVLYEHFPESKRKIRKPNIDWDEELLDLLEKVKLKASEKNLKELLKKVFKQYVKEPISRKSQTKKHTKYVPKHLARYVRERDNFQCTFISQSGRRCNQRAHLQIDHIRPYGMGGSSHDSNNLRLLCRAHNLYKARLDFPKQEKKSRLVTASDTNQRKVSLPSRI